MSSEESQKKENQPLPPPHAMFYPYPPYAHCPHYPCYPVPLLEQFQEFLKVQEEKMKLTDTGRAEKDKEVKVEAAELDNEKKEDKGLSCQCTKSNCLKEYCYCFKNGAACGEKCGCTSCKNDQDELNEKRHPQRKKKVTCKCSKSQCKKKYCECYTAQKKCGDTCGCTGCEN